jgi:hypothetical protein
VGCEREQSTGASSQKRGRRKCDYRWQHRGAGLTDMKRLSKILLAAVDSGQEERRRRKKKKREEQMQMMDLHYKGVRPAQRAR